MNIFKNQFEDLAEEDVKVLKEYFNGGDYRGASYTFLANYIWRTTYCLCWEVIEDYLVMAGADCMIGEPNARISMPLTKDGNYEPEKLKRVLLEAKKRFDDRKIRFSIELIPKHMVHLINDTFSGEVELTHDRDSDEYVYLKEKLISLSGRALHKKKNHMNFFKKTYSYEAKRVTREMVPEIMEFVRSARDGKTFDPDEMESLRMEEEAISQILNFVEDENVFGCVIVMDGKIQAFSIGELLNEDTAVAHFEKANDDYRGLYQVICSEFCKMLPEEVVYVNREEDMGLENLRQAKEALKPEYMEEKYSCCFLK